MKAVALIAAAALVALPAGADAKRGRKHRRHAMVAKVSRGKGIAPFAWTVPPPAATAPAVAAPVATPTPAPEASPAPTPTPAPPSDLPGDNPHSVSVRSTEYRFSLSQPAVDAGQVKVQFDNSRAEDAHALAYDGPSADAFDSVAAGAVVRYTVALSAGTYTLFCPLPEHEQLGMKATLTVR